MSGFNVNVLLPGRCAWSILGLAYTALAADQEAIDLLHRPLDLPALHAAEKVALGSEPTPSLQGSAVAPNPAVPRTESLFSFTYLKLLAEDVKATFIAPASWDTSEWLTFAGVTAGLAGLTLLDDEIRETVQDNRSETLDDIAKGIQPLGSYYSFGLLGGFYLGGELFHDDRAKATALDGLSASLISGLIIVEPLKRVVGRGRPAEGPSDRFQPFGDAKSLPSGHATQAFAIATVISEHYQSLWVSTVSYGLAGMVGFARIEQDAHWLSDVAIGAVIGTFVGHVVVQQNKQQRAIRIEPVLGPGLTAVQLSFAF